MKLPFTLPFGNKPVETDYYLILVLRDEKISAVILEEHAEALSVKNLYEEILETPLEQIDPDTLTQLLDKTISKAEEVLPPDVQTQKTIFGVKDSWVEEKKIKKQFLDILKQVGSTLGLKPIGFLVISEAIAHQIQLEEGAPLSGIVAEIGKYSVTLTLFKGGRLIETHSGPLDESITHTVDTLLKHMVSVEILPSRLLLLNADHQSNIQQEFISHQWSKSLPFLHMPQISLLSENFDAIAAVYGAGTQMNFSVLSTAFTKQASDITPLEAHTRLASTKEEDTSTSIGDAQDKSSVPEEKKAEVKQTKAERADEEAADKKAAEDKQEEKELDTLKTGADNFGFVMDEDISNIMKPTVSQTTPSVSNVSEPFFPSTATETNLREEPAEDPGEIDETLPARSRRNASSPLAGLIGMFSRISLPNIAGIFRSLPLARLGGNKKVVLLPLTILVIGILVILAYGYIEKATVTLFIKQKAFDDTASITFGVDAGNDFGSNVIGAKTVTVRIDGTVTGDATGKKDIGDKAKGSITLYNSGDTDKTLPAGTTITSSTSVAFTLDSSTTIPGSSGDIFSGTKPGTAPAQITAKNLGPEGNLPSGTKFTVSGSTTVAGRNDSAFSGGSKKTVQVVAKADRDKLLLQLPKQLEDQAKSEIGKKVVSGEVLLPFDLDTHIDKQEFDKAVDDQAKQVTLTGSVTFTGVIYKTDDLKQYTLGRVKEKTSSDISLADNNLKEDVSNLKKVSDNQISGTLTMKAGLLPTIDISHLQQNIKGKPIPDALAYLKTLPQTEKVEITFSPSIPLLTRSLPKRVSNIHIAVNSYE
jgi:hypothetical protein